MGAHAVPKAGVALLQVKCLHDSDVCRILSCFGTYAGRLAAEQVSITTSTNGMDCERQPGFTNIG